MNELKRLLSHLGPYKKDLLLGAFLVLVETCFELIIPVLMADLIDIGVENRDIPYILSKGIQMGVCALLSLLTGLLYARFAARAAYGFGARLRDASYTAVQQYAFSNLDHFESSSLVTRMTTDIAVVQNTVISGLRPMIRGPVMLLFGIGLSVWLNAKLALVFFVCAPILAVILFFIVRRISPMYSRLQKVIDRLNGTVQENLTAVRTVKAFVRGSYEKEKFNAVNEELQKNSQHTFRYAVLNLPAFQFTMYTATVAIMWFGGNMVLDKSLEVGGLTGFLSYVLLVLNSLMMLSNVFLLLTRSLASARRIGETLEETPDILPPAQAYADVADGSIRFDHVSFKYAADAEEYALSDISLDIPAGQTVGIIGGTGSAKSTLVQLIPRLYDVSEGSVSVGGRDVRSYDLKALRDAVGIVLQKNVLFSGTVRDNLLWGNPKADDETIWAACQTACADEFLKKMPNGLDTNLGQGGVNLSGGQKQRLCIARTLLKNPKILIFDDSTSAVDTATERRIRTALAQNKAVTKLIIAQRITSVMEADRILILDDGKLHAAGTHSQLLANDPIYQEIYALQMKGGDENGTAV